MVFNREIRHLITFLRRTLALNSSTRTINNITISFECNTMFVFFTDAINAGMYFLMIFIKKLGSILLYYNDNIDNMVNGNNDTYYERTCPRLNLKNKNFENKLREFGRWGNYIGSEESGTMNYWQDLISILDKNIHDVRTEQHDNNTGFSNVSIDSHNMLIEQKAPGVNLDKLEYCQKTLKTPLEQVLEYVNSRVNPPAVLIICNFSEIRFYDRASVSAFHVKHENEINHIKTTIANNQRNKTEQFQQDTIKLASNTDAFYALSDKPLSQHNNTTANDSDANMKPSAEILSHIRSRTIPEPETLFVYHVKTNASNDEANKLKAMFTRNAITRETLDNNNVENNKQAAEHFQRLYDVLNIEYENQKLNDDYNYEDDLAKLTTGLTFMFYADAIGIFKPNQLVDYLNYISDKSMLKDGVRSLFKAVGIHDPVQRAIQLNGNVRDFPYISDLFTSYVDIYIPDMLNDEVFNTIISVINNYDWKNIDAVIFGSMMEDLLNTDDRRQNGIHWTPAKYIHRIIDPLCIDSLTIQLNSIINTRSDVAHIQYVSKLQAFIDKLTKYRFIDLACGSANFLAETYLTMRHLENQALKAMYDEHVSISEIKVRVKPCMYAGIKYNKYAYTVAIMTMMIAEAKAINETITLIPEYDGNMLPLEGGYKLVNADALAYDWNNLFDAHVNNEDSHENTDKNDNELCSHADNTFIHVIGNPPFVGKGRKTTAQNESLSKIMTDYVSMSSYYANDLKINKDIIRNTGYADYCYGWFYKAADYLMDYPADKCSFSFISTANINKGVQVKYMKPITDNNWDLKFAYEPFKWANESKDANVIVMITSFNKNNINNDGKHYMFTDNAVSNNTYNNDEALKIVDYKTIDTGGSYVIRRKDDALILVCSGMLSFTGLNDSENVYVIERKTPVSQQLMNVKIQLGTEPADGGKLMLTRNEYENLTDDDRKYIKPYLNGLKLMNGTYDYCIWIPNDSMPSDATDFIRNRVKACQEWRSSQSKTGSVYGMKDTPWIFRKTSEQFNHELYALARITELKEYIAVIETKNVVLNDQIIMTDEPCYILNSYMSSWCRQFGNKRGVGGADSMSVSKIYNTFPMPCIDNDILNELDRQSQAVFNIQDKYLNHIPNNDADIKANNNESVKYTPAELYRSKSMPTDLLNAHHALDRMFDALFTIMTTSIGEINNPLTSGVNPFTKATGGSMNTRISYDDYVSKLNEMNDNHTHTIISDSDRIRMMIACYNYLIKNE